MTNPITNHITKHKARRNDDGERVNKMLIVSCICLSALLLISTACILALRGMVIPDAVDRLTISVVSGIIGWLGKTGTTPAEGNRQPPSGQEIGEGVVEASQDTPIKTDPVNDNTNENPKDLVPIGRNV